MLFSIVIKEGIKKGVDNQGNEIPGDVSCGMMLSVLAVI